MTQAHGEPKTCKHERARRLAPSGPSLPTRYDGRKTQTMKSYHEQSDEQSFEGYGEWSADLDRAEDEAAAWEGAARVPTPAGTLLIKPSCNRAGLHRDCPIHRCERAHREGGYDL